MQKSFSNNSGNVGGSIAVVIDGFETESAEVVSLATVATPTAFNRSPCSYRNTPDECIVRDH